MFHGPLSAIVSEHGRVTSAGHFILTAPKTLHPYKTHIVKQSICDTVDDQKSSNNETRKKTINNQQIQRN